MNKKLEKKVDIKKVDVKDIDIKKVDVKDIDMPAIYKILKKEVTKFRAPVIELVEAQTKDPFKVLVATILSARTKDTLTIKVVSRLWKKVNSVSDLSRLTVKQIEKLIYPVGFYHTKARHLKELPKVLNKEFGGEIPSTVEELVKLPGVGRKTANLVVGTAFHKPAVCVDVHVHRITNRLGYLKTKNPYETEMELRRILPKKYWVKLNTYLVAYGQNVCAPISPNCSKCVIRKYCNKVGVRKSR